MGIGGAATSEDLGSITKHSKENYGSQSGEEFHVNRELNMGPSVLRDGRTLFRRAESFFLLSVFCIIYL